MVWWGQWELTCWNSLSTCCGENVSGTLVLTLVYPGTITCDIPPLRRGTILGCKTENSLEMLLEMSLEHEFHGRVIRKVSDMHTISRK